MAKKSELKGSAPTSKLAQGEVIHFDMFVETPVDTRFGVTSIVGFADENGINFLEKHLLKAGCLNF